MACFNSIVINSPIEKVWQKVKDFHDFSWAPNVITTLEAVGDKTGMEVGAKRVLNDAFHETLTAFNELEHYFQYSIDDGPSPVSKDDVKNYRADVYLIPITSENKTFIKWVSAWERATNNEETTDFCNPIYAAILSDLAKQFT